MQNGSRCQLACHRLQLLIFIMRGAYTCHTRKNIKETTVGQASWDTSQSFVHSILLIITLKGNFLNSVVNPWNV